MMPTGTNDTSTILNNTSREIERFFLPGIFMSYTLSQAILFYNLLIIMRLLLFTITVFIIVDFIKIESKYR